MDPYGTNPLAEQVAETYPGRFAAISTVAPPPKLFQGGNADVPAFTASGIDPQTLLRLPFAMRHAAADNPDIQQVYSWFEEYGSIPDARIESEGLRNAEARIQKWMDETHDPRPAEVIAAESRAEYEQYERSRSADGLLPQEREQKRRDDWAAKKADETARTQARNAARQAQIDRKFFAAQPAHERARWGR